MHNHVSPDSPFNYHRRSTVTVHVGQVPLGSHYPIRLQSMTNTDTNQIELSAQQCMRIAQSGADYVRLTAQGTKQAHNIGVIGQALREASYHIPLIADIHFNPQAALEAARVCQGVRINPGNFADPARTFKQLDYTPEQYSDELQRIHQSLLPLIEICRQHHTALRLGVNHGSLSDRIMSRYGDTAVGMVESVMEYLRVLVREQFLDVVISMKASNVVVMVEAVRRLVVAMDAEDMHFPLHLGVTEAGFGEDGRIKSAVGIGALLAEGLGDTIRVSLSEEPELEIPVAQKLVTYISTREGHTPIKGNYSQHYDPICPQRRNSVAVGDMVGGNKPPIVIANHIAHDTDNANMAPDFCYNPYGLTDNRHHYIVPFDHWTPQPNVYPMLTLNQWDDCKEAKMRFLQIADSTPAQQLAFLRGRADTVLVVTPSNLNIPGGQQALIHGLTDLGVSCPIVAHNTYADDDLEWLQVKAGADFGTLLLNGVVDGIWLDTPHCDKPAHLAYAILQAARQRMSKTEFISCPGCGRTLFDLQTTVRQVQQATSHLKHLKIGVMGCIVNGPGEMADADYGYVGAAPHRISLYKGKHCIEKNIPEEKAIEYLIAIIKENGDWIEPTLE